MRIRNNNILTTTVNIIRNRTQEKDKRCERKERILHINKHLLFAYKQLQNKDNYHT
ncbi:hypothetical protein Hanom_Chr15g01360911 [Helianthus anomalus]